MTTSVPPMHNSASGSAICPTIETDSISHDGTWMPNVANSTPARLASSKGLVTIC